MPVGYRRRELTDYSFGGTSTGSVGSVYVYLFISNTLPPMLYLRDRFDRVILHFLTYVPRLGPVTIAVRMVADNFYSTTVALALVCDVTRDFAGALRNRFS